MNPLCEAFRRGDEAAVIAILKHSPDLRQIGGEAPLRAACWFGMEETARLLVERWGAQASPDLAEIAAKRGHAKLAEWLEGAALRRAGRELEQRQLSFIA